MLFLLSALLLGGCAQQGEGSGWQPDEALRQAADGLDSYQYELLIHPQTRELSLSLRLSLSNRDSQPYEDLLLRTWAGAYETMVASPYAHDALRELYYPDGFSPGGLTLHDVYWRDQAVSHRFLDEAHTMLSISIPSLAPGDEGELRLRCVVKLPESPGRLGIDQGVWTLGNLLPVLAVRDAGAWRTDPSWHIGDPFVSEAANYQVSLSLPEGWQALSSAPLDKPALALRDYALVLTQGFVRQEAQAGGTRLIAQARQGKDAELLLRLMRKGFDFLSERYGLYPWPTLSLTQTAFPLAGMEHTGLILISEAYLKQDRLDELELLVVHELAHQWFFAQVGSDQAREPWLDEALCDWAVLSYVRQTYGQTAYQDLMRLRVELPMQASYPPGLRAGSPIWAFQSLQDYVGLVYGKASGLMAAIQLDTGRMDAFLKHYVASFRHQLVSRAMFEEALNAFMGKDLRPLVSDYLDND